MRLAQALLEAGLLQFGHFVTPSGSMPYRLRLDMLPSYPALLALVAQAALVVLRTQAPVEFMLSTPDSTPFAVALSQQAKLPLVYSRGRGEAPVHDLVGAYDVGHPACLVLNTPDDIEIKRVLAAGARTGLAVGSVLALVDTQVRLPIDLPLLGVLRLENAVDELAASGNLPEKQRQAVLRRLLQ